MPLHKLNRTFLTLSLIFCLVFVGFSQIPIDSLRSIIIQFEQTGSFRLALDSSKSYLARARKISDKILITDSYLFLARNSYKLGQTREALKFYKLYVVELEDFKDNNRINSYYRQRTFYENEVKALQSQIKENEEEISALTSDKNKLLKAGNIVYYGLMVVFIIASLLLTGWVYNKLKSSGKRKKQDGQDVQEKELMAMQLLINRITEKNDLFKAEINLNDILAEKTFPTPLVTLQNLKYVKKSFVFWQPKLASSGNQLWVQALKGYLVIAIIDAPLHGSAGSLLTSLIVEQLRQLVLVDLVTAPPLILNQLEQNVRKMFPSGIPFNEGVNIGICTYDAGSRSITFSSANSTLYVVVKHQLLQQSGEDKPMFLEASSGGYYHSSVMEIKRKTRIYLSTKGYWNQIGGHDHAPLKQSTFEKTLQSLHAQKFDDHEQILSKMFFEWKDSNEQSDDVLVAGFEF